MVVLNACDLGRIPSGPATPTGFARTFLHWGAGAFIGCSWPVGDQPAAEFADAFYDGLVAQHLTIREAAMAARVLPVRRCLGARVICHAYPRCRDPHSAPPVRRSTETLERNAAILLPALEFVCATTATRAGNGRPRRSSRNSVHT